MAAHGSPLTIRHLLPEDQVLQVWLNIENARAFAGLDGAVLKEVLGYVGDEDLTNLVLFAGIDPGVIRKAMEEVTVTNQDGQARGLTPLEKTKLGLVYNGARAKFSLELVDVTTATVAAPPPGGAGPPAVAATPSAGINPLLKIRVSSVLDQASDAEVEALPLADILKLRRHYLAVAGGEPQLEADFTDNQVSALKRVVDTGSAPFADFGVWGQFGNRLERANKFRTQVRDADGHLRTVEVPGPNC